MPSMLRRNLALDLPSPEVQRDLEDFLGMGHAQDCWCRNSSHIDQTYAGIPVSDCAEQSDAQSATEAKSTTLQTLDSDQAIMSRTKLDSTSSTGSTTFLADAVYVAPPSNPTESDWTDLGLVDVQSPSSDDEDWVAVSPGLHAHHPHSLSTSRSISAAPTPTLGSPSVVAPPSTALPSPPLTPLVLPSQTRDEGTESEET